MMPRKGTHMTDAPAAADLYCTAKAAFEASLQANLAGFLVKM